MKDPISDRDAFYMFFPKWLVDYVIGPFPDEIGLPAFLFKWGTVGAFLAFMFPNPPVTVPLCLIALGGLLIWYGKQG